VVGFLIWAWSYLRPHRWYKLTDQVSFEQVARDVTPGHVVWDPAGPEEGGLADQDITQPAISSDGARLVYSAGHATGNANLFLRRWDGTSWGPPRPMRALNSQFHETGPSLRSQKPRNPMAVGILPGMAGRVDMMSPPPRSRCSHSMAAVNATTAIADTVQHVRGGEHGGSYGYTDPPGRRNSGRHGMNAASFFSSQLTGSSFNSAMAYESASILNEAGFKYDDLYYAYYGTFATYQHQEPVWRVELHEDKARPVLWEDPKPNRFEEQQADPESGKSTDPVNQPTGRMEASFSADGTMMILVRWDPRQSNADMFLSRWDGRTWSRPEALTTINSASDELGPALSADGKRLFFSSDRSATGSGSSNIFVAERVADKPPETEAREELPEPPPKAKRKPKKNARKKPAPPKSIQSNLEPRAIR
jgi:hypothetical protein